MKNKYFYDTTKIDNDISNIIGNKCYNTYLLKSKGFTVPKSIFVSVQLFDLYVSNNVQDFNKSILELKNCLTSQNFSNSLAIRSSALLFDTDKNIIKEDSETLSMAGWFKSNLNVSINNITDSIIDCYSIIDSKVLNENIKNHFYGNLKIKIALLIQDFYEAEKSAVIYTKNQFPYNRGNFLINATLGACNGLVSGEITGDAYWINRNNSMILKNYSSKKTKMYVNNQSNIILVDVPHNLQEKETLSSNDIKTLFDLGMSVEKAFKSPQDIELVYNSDKGWIIVQTRPINYWRNFNE